MLIIELYLVMQLKLKNSLWRFGSRSISSCKAKRSYICNWQTFKSVKTHMHLHVSKLLVRTAGCTINMQQTWLFIVKLPEKLQSCNIGCVPLMTLHKKTGINLFSLGTQPSFQGSIFFISVSFICLVQFLKCICYCIHIWMLVNLFV